MLQILTPDKIIEFTKKITGVFLIKEKIETVGSENKKAVINTKKSKAHCKRNYCMMKSYLKPKQMQLYHKFSLLMNLIKMDSFYENIIFFDYMISLIENYFRSQENCYEEVVFGLNFLEISLSIIEKRLLTENFYSNYYFSIYLIYFLLVSTENQEKIMNIFIDLNCSIPYDDLKFFSIYEAINNLNDRNLLKGFCSPSVSS